MLSPAWNIVKYTICINDRLWRFSLKIVKSLLQLYQYIIFPLFYNISFTSIKLLAWTSLDTVKAKGYILQYSLIEWKKVIAS
jgi:hypothetical protein